MSETMYGSAAAQGYAGTAGVGMSEPKVNGPLLADADSSVIEATKRVESAVQQARNIADALFGVRPTLVGNGGDIGRATPQAPPSRGDSLRGNLSLLHTRISDLSEQLQRFEAL